MVGHDHSIRHHRSGHASCLGACPGLLGTPDIAHCWFRSKETNEEFSEEERCGNQFDIAVFSSSLEWMEVVG